MIQYIFNGLFALAALVAILDYFGIKPKKPSERGVMPLSRRWKLVIMLVLVASSLGLSVYGFYRSQRPIIVEKIVEKPVERLVPQQCPKLNEAPPHKPVPPKASAGATKSVSQATPPPVTINQDCGGGNCAATSGQKGGITAGQLNVGSLPASVTLTLDGQANRPSQFHDTTLYLSIFRVNVSTSSVPILTITAAHPKLVRVGCTKLRPGTLMDSSESHGVPNGMGSCSVDSAFGENQLFSVETTEPVETNEIQLTTKCEGVICQQ